MRFLGNTFILLYVILLCSASSRKPTTIIKYEDEHVKSRHETENGLYDGKYTSWYKSGKKKAEGEFRNNMRFGTWTVWDSSGRKRMVREYANNFEYKLLFPVPSTDGPIPILSESKYKLEYNSSGYISYSYLFERAVHSSKRIWRYVAKDAQNPLFANDKFYHSFVDSILAGKIKLYATSDDDFRMQLTGRDLITLSDTVGYEVIGYKIKEDWFFDEDRMLSETRTIGILPVIRRKKMPADSFEIGWIYFPYLRSTLASQKVIANRFPTYIHSLDDVFFFRYFHGDIYKESNVYDRTLNDEVAYTHGQLTNARLRVESDLIEMEHDAWIFYSP